jgi:hypothetical protein
MIFNGQITYGDMFSIVLVLGIIAIVMISGLALLVSMWSRRK